MRNISSQSAFALIKFFSQKEHYLSFKKGINWFQTPHYYRTCEDVGRGDSNESCIYFWNETLPKNKPNFIKSIDYKQLKNILIYPADEQHDSWMQSWAVIGPNNGFENSLEKMRNDFGYYFVILPAANIPKYMSLVEKASGFEVRHGLIRYSEDPIKRSLTVKSAEFSYQKEYRFYIGNCSKDELEKKSLYLPDINNILLGAESLKIESRDGTTRYCSVGHKELVTVDPMFRGALE